MITPLAEKQIWSRIDLSLQNIRQLICSLGMSAPFHIAKAERVLAGEYTFLSNSVFEGETVSADYLESLNDLIYKTVSYSERCAKLWQPLPSAEQSLEYRRNFQKLTAHLHKFNFTDQYYENLARIKEKPLLDRAYSLIEEHNPEARRVNQIEKQVRMLLSEFIENQETIDQNLENIDRLRSEMEKAHDWMAVRAARKSSLDDQKVYQAAKYAIWKAAQMFDHSRGYRFEKYAVWWVTKEVESLS